MTRIQNKSNIQKAQYRNRQIWKPRSANNNDIVQECPYCNGYIESTYVICPHCGRSLTPGKCSFCGAIMKENAGFCSKCGQSREGIICPQCHTLNSRNFCRNCNSPLTPRALQAYAEAESDPAFIVLQTKAQELADLHARINELSKESTGNTDNYELSDSDKALLNEYNALLSSLGAPLTPSAHKMEKIPDQWEKIPDRQSYEDRVMSLDEIMKAYREKAAEMDMALSSLAPPPEYTPEQQRDYYCARKIARIKTEYDMSGYSPTSWICNYCGATHNSPAECAEPQLGGKWVYTSPEQYIQSGSAIIKSQSLNID